jgi:hypothetical protein
VIVVVPEPGGNRPNHLILFFFAVEQSLVEPIGLDVDVLWVSFRLIRRYSVIHSLSPA